jgi:hypothetical protein
LFIGWVQDYASAMMAMRKDGASVGGLSHNLISPRARIILLSFIYFYLLLIAGAFGNVVVSTAIGLKSSPMAWLFLTIAGLLAGQMIYRWKKDIILTTVLTVLLCLFGIWLGSVGPSDKILGPDLANSRWLWAIAAFAFCYFAAVLPIWRFALPINYVASYIVFLGLFFGIIGVLILHPNFTRPATTDFTIKIGPIWPIMFVTVACGAISGWHSMVSSSGTARQLEHETELLSDDLHVRHHHRRADLHLLTPARKSIFGRGQGRSPDRQRPDGFRRLFPGHRRPDPRRRGLQGFRPLPRTEGQAGTCMILTDRGRGALEVECMLPASTPALKPCRFEAVKP